MLTSDDIGKLIDRLVTIFTTKQELNEGLQNLEEKLDLKFQNVLTKMDAVYKEVKDFRQEQDMHVQMHRDTDERLDKLESTTAAM